MGHAYSEKWNYIHIYLLKTKQYIKKIYGELQPMFKAKFKYSLTRFKGAFENTNLKNLHMKFLSTLHHSLCC